GGGKILPNTFIFRFKKSICSTKLESIFIHLLVMLLPTSEKSRSEGTDVAQIPKYLRAIEAKIGNFFSCNFHHSRGSVFLPSSFISRYLSISSLLPAGSLGHA
ncbi:hypothetical protein RhiirA5_12498, partial [Rhizophagus irregularis]